MSAKRTKQRQEALVLLRQGNSVSYEQLQGVAGIEGKGNAMRLIRELRASLPPGETIANVNSNGYVLLGATKQPKQGHGWKRQQ